MKGGHRLPTWGILIATAFWAGCGTPPKPPAKVSLRGNLRVDTVSGIRRMNNLGPSGWTDTSGWRWVLERVVDPPEGTPGELGQVLQLAVEDGGNLYVLEGDPARIDRFGPDGKYLRTIGRQGQGPGDLEPGPMALFGDTLAIQDAQGGRLTLFTIDGNYLGTARTACCLGEPPIAVDTAGRIWVPGSMMFDGRPGWVRLTTNLKPVDRIPMPHDTTVAFPPKVWSLGVTNRGQPAKLLIRVPLQTAVVSAVRRDGLIVTGRTDRSTLFLVTAAGDTLRRIDFPSPAVPITAQQRDSILTAATASARGGSGQQADLSKAASPDDIPAEWPRWSGFRLDGADRLWLAIPGPAGAASRLLVFDAGGTLIGEVPSPTPHLLDAAMARDHIAVLAEGGNGRPVIHIYRLETGPGARH